MLIAVPWHLMWFKQQYHDFGIYTRAEPIIPLGMATMILQGGVMAWLYPRWYRGGAPALEGIKFSLLIGLFLFSVSTLATIAKTDVSDSGQFILLSAIFHTMQFVLSGAAIGLIFGRIDSKPV
jgi:hypothetical protein